MSYMSTPGIPRGCGFRTEGGVYLETGVGCFGSTSIWKFISDVPVPYTAPHTLGVDIVNVGGVNHVVNHVGSRYWPTPADFIEEGLRWGFSTKVPKTQDLSILTKDSRIIHVHTLGGLLNPESFGKHIDATQHCQRCARHLEACFVPRISPTDYLEALHLERAKIADPEQYHAHVLNPAFAWSNPNELAPTGCNFYHWAFAQPSFMEAMDGDEVVAERLDGEELEQVWESRNTTRIPSIFRQLANSYTLRFYREGNKHGTNRYEVYPIFAKNPDHDDPRWCSAMIAAFPLTNISVIQAGDDSHLDTLAKKQAEASGTFPVTEAEA